MKRFFKYFNFSCCHESELIHPNGTVTHGYNDAKSFGSRKKASNEEPKNQNLPLVSPTEWQRSIQLSYALQTCCAGFFAITYGLWHTRREPPLYLFIKDGCAVDYSVPQSPWGSHFNLNRRRLFMPPLVTHVAIPKGSYIICLHLDLHRSVTTRLKLSMADRRASIWAIKF